jgi:ABC-type transport system involved in multi-copper enzyme maturation permease subunit
VSQTTNSRGEIHDLGYARYAGPRRPPSASWQVIARQQIAFAWATWWRWKLALGFAVVTTAIGAAILYFVPGGGADRTIAMTTAFYRLPAFIVTMTLTSTLVARDVETGAFGFYFSRPVRPIDYVLGKLVGNFGVMASLLVAGPLLLSLVRMAVAESWSATQAALPMMGVTLLVGVVAALFFTAVPLAMSALLGRRWLALGLWAGYYVPLTTMLAVMGSLRWTPLMAADPPHALNALAFRLGGIKFPSNDPHPSLEASGIALAVVTLAALVAFAAMVMRRGSSSVGASS